MPSEAADVVWMGQPTKESCGEFGSIAVRTP
jgi:hypothetical protein